MLLFSAKVFLGAGILSYGFIVLFARWFFLLFTPGDLELVRFAQSRSLLYFSGFFLAGLNILMISFWQSTGQTRRAMAVSLMRSLIAPPILIALLPLFFKSGAIWVCHSLSEAATACLALFLLLAASRKRKTAAQALSLRKDG